MVRGIPFLLVWMIAPLCFAIPQKTRVPDPDRNVHRPEGSQADRESQLLEVGKALKLRQVSSASTELKVVSYNIRWRSGDELNKLIRLFQTDQEIGNAAIMGLQEVDRKKKRSNSVNTIRLLAEELGMYYAWTAPPTPEKAHEEETGVAILSVFPLSDVRRIVLPHEGPNGRRRVAVGATARIGVTSLRLYSIHAETRIALDKKIEQMDAVLQDLNHYPKEMSAIVLGDFNTWEASAGRKTGNLFTKAGFQTPFGSQATFSRRILLLPIQFRLDWVWLRGLQYNTYGIDRAIGISDHWPLWVNVKVARPQEIMPLRN